MAGAHASGPENEGMVGADGVLAARCGLDGITGGAGRDGGRGAGTAVRCIRWRVASSWPRHRGYPERRRGARSRSAQRIEAGTADGVVYAGSTAPAGANMYALDAANGHILWRFASGGSVMSGAAIARGRVYWGSGYVFPPVSCPSPAWPLRYCLAGNDKFYAFALPAPGR